MALHAAMHTAGAKTPPLALRALLLALAAAAAPLSLASGEMHHGHILMGAYTAKYKKDNIHPSNTSHGLPKFQ